MSAVFAASHPERVSALVPYGGAARTRWAPDYLFGTTEREDRLNIEEGLEQFLTGEGTEEMVRSGMPSADEDEVRAWARVFRYGASPASLEALDRMNAAKCVRCCVSSEPRRWWCINGATPGCRSSTAATWLSTSRAQGLQSSRVMSTFPARRSCLGCWRR
jgi:hypothetical protein